MSKRSLRLWPSPRDVISLAPVKAGGMGSVAGVPCWKVPGSYGGQARKERQGSGTLCNGRVGVSVAHSWQWHS